MSDVKSNPYAPPRSSAPKAENSMRWPPASFRALLTLNLIACYFPWTLWTRLLPDSSWWNLSGFIHSPILFTWLVGGERFPSVWLVLFLALVIATSYALRKSLAAMTVIPLLLFLYSLLQGILAASLAQLLSAG